MNPWLSRSCQVGGASARIPLYAGEDCEPGSCCRRRRRCGQSSPGPSVFPAIGCSRAPTSARGHVTTPRASARSPLLLARLHFGSVNIFITNVTETVAREITYEY